MQQHLENEPETIERYFLAIIHTMKHIQDEKMMAYGVTSQQGRLLGNIYHCQLINREINQKDLEKIMGLRGPSITSLLKGLEKKGLITRNSGVEDNRTKQPVITERGLDLVKSLHRVFLETTSMLTKGMTQEEENTLRRLLEIVYQNLDADSY
jgi:MarR family transcriptional repressor of mepA